MEHCCHSISPRHADEHMGAGNCFTLHGPQTSVCVLGPHPVQARSSVLEQLARKSERPVPRCCFKRNGLRLRLTLSKL